LALITVAFNCDVFLSAQAWAPFKTRLSKRQPRSHVCSPVFVWYMS
jgi:hypothetical protein